MNNASGLKVCIIGSGIAGLTAARVLREHHTVTIFERGPLDVATGGQGIVVTAQATRILLGLGYNPSTMVPSGGARILDKQTNILKTVPMGTDPKHGVDGWSGRRVNFRGELFRLATAPSAELGIGGEPAKVVAETPVVDIDPVEGKVVLENGSTVQADIIIVADGIHSRLRHKVLGEDKYVAKPTGLTIYRVIVSIEEARKSDPSFEFPDWFQPTPEGKGSSALIEPRDGTNRMVVAYPCENFRHMHISLVLPDRERKSGSADGATWYDDADVAEVVDEFADIPEIVNLVKLGSEAKVWQMRDLEPVPFWNKGRAILIGDAAHAMTPMQGQGGNMAVEDAESFRLLRDVKADAVPEVLQTIDSLRRPRATHILLSTKAMTPESSLEDRMNNFKYILDYDGILEALKQKEETK